MRRHDILKTNLAAEAAMPMDDCNIAPVAWSISINKILTPGSATGIEPKFDYPAASISELQNMKSEVHRTTLALFQKQCVLIAIVCSLIFLCGCNKEYDLADSSKAYYLDQGQSSRNI